MFQLNYRSARLAKQLLDNSDYYHVNLHRIGYATVIDCGCNARGGLDAGLLLARIALADCGQVSLCPSNIPGLTVPMVQVATDHPLQACMLSQYAGWQIKTDDYFAMGSGPMRCLTAKEELINEIGYHEESDVAVGVLESDKLPTPGAIEKIQKQLPDCVSSLILCVASTNSIAGTLQVVARSVESAMHKLHTVGYNIQPIRSGHGLAPLPPVTSSSLKSIGLTNDSILYGTTVTLWVDSPNDELDSFGPLVPSSTSKDYGELFIDLFERYNGDFYKIDPNLFAPARITLNSLSTGHVVQAGSVNADMLRKSFYGQVGQS